MVGGPHGHEHGSALVPSPPLPPDPVVLALAVEPARKQVEPLVLQWNPEQQSSPSMQSWPSPPHTSPIGPTSWQSSVQAEVNRNSSGRHVLRSSRRVSTRIPFSFAGHLRKGARRSARPTGSFPSEQDVKADLRSVWKTTECLGRAYSVQIDAIRRRGQCARRMDSAAREALELEIRSKAAAMDHAGATTAALRGYGPEVLRFLVGLHGETGAADVFSVFSEGIWLGVRSFDWSCTFRTYAFAVARRASLRFRRDQGRRCARELPLEVLGPISEIEFQIRSETLSYLKTAKRNRFAELRDELPPDDRALLMLRIDQRLSWLDCARALHDSEAPLTETELARESARLRKRFQLLKERLLDIGRKEGLLGQ